MASTDIKLTELPTVNLVDLDDNDILYIVNNNTLSGQVKLSDLASYVNSAYFVPTYYKASTTNVAIAGDTYEEVLALTTPLLPIGTYEFKMSMTYNLDSTTHSAFFRFSTDNGTTWHEFNSEPKDKTDNRAIYYAYPIVYDTETVANVKIEMRKEDAANVLNVVYLDTMFERKL